MHLSDRIECAELVRGYVPDYSYCLVENHGFSEAELKEHGDEMSLLMLINRIQSAKDFTAFRNNDLSHIASGYKHASSDIQHIIQRVIWSLMMNINVSEQQAGNVIKALEENDMGNLFQNIEDMDIQKERNNTRKANKRANKAERRARESERRAKEAERRAKDATQKVIKAEQKTAQSIVKMIISEKQAGLNIEETTQKISDIFDIDIKAAEDMVKSEWK